MLLDFRTSLRRHSLLAIVNQRKIIKLSVGWLTFLPRTLLLASLLYYFLTYLICLSHPYAGNLFPFPDPTRRLLPRKTPSVFPPTKAALFHWVITTFQLCIALLRTPVSQRFVKMRSLIHLPTTACITPFFSKIFRELQRLRRRSCIYLSWTGKYVYLVPYSHD